MEVRRIMTSDPACCTPNTPLRDVAMLMVERDCGQIPVVEETGSKRTLGVITDRDIVLRTLARGQNPLDVTAGEVMSKPAVTVRPDMDVEECCRVLEEKQIRRAPVEDEKGCCCGIVSLADIAQNAPEPVTAEVIRTVSQPGPASGRRMSV
jgi:CBS domain-containing protein